MAKDGQTAKDITHIYALIDPRTKKVRYIGKADDPVRRYKQHLYGRKHLTFPVYVWINELYSQNLKPEMKILAKVPLHEWEEAEKVYISQYRTEAPLLNVHDGGNQPIATGDTERGRVAHIKSILGNSLRNGELSSKSRALLRKVAEQNPKMFGEYENV